MISKILMNSMHHDYVTYQKELMLSSNLNSYTHFKIIISKISMNAIYMKKMIEKKELMLSSNLYNN